MNSKMMKHMAAAAAAATLVGAANAAIVTWNCNTICISYCDSY